MKCEPCQWIVSQGILVAMRPPHQDLNALSIFKTKPVNIG
jgi:hypothetical protein